jgi:hypothetical protein
MILPLVTSRHRRWGCLLRCQIEEVAPADVGTIETVHR